LLDTKIELSSYKYGSLRELDFKTGYRSDSSNIIRDFYIPCMQRSVLYQRAVGYFTSRGLEAAAEGLAAFIQGAGRMQLVASPFFIKEDIEAIRQGYDSKESIINRSLSKSLEELRDEIQQHRLECLAWLVSTSRLDVKIAIPVDRNMDPTGGLYHEKIGIFEDNLGNYVAFIGSSNETENGLVSNFESIDVFWSWDDPQERGIEKKNYFKNLWTSTTHGLWIVDFPEAARSALLRYKTSSPPTSDFELQRKTKVSFHQKDSDLQIPEALRIRDYQLQAQKAWFNANGRGIFKMATGTGKTITSLTSAVRLYELLREKGLGLAIVIICPFIHLVEQWAEVCKDFFIEPTTCYGSRKDWMGELDDLVSDYNAKVINTFTVISTNATFRSNAFQDRIKRIQGAGLLIGDEVHNLGAVNLLDALPDNFEYRLGLSATPERWFDDEGTSKLQEFFGSTVFELGLKDAIGSGALTPYDYYPHIVELTEEETEEYINITKKIAKYYQMDKNRNRNVISLVESLLFKRTRLLANAQMKLTALFQIMKHNSDSTHNLIYCGDGRVEYNPDEQTSNQLREVVRLLGAKLGMKVNSYIGETYIDRRHELRKQFASGNIQALVAIRCLDEGVDIPETRRAFILASSRNPRQFIQRRGRVLRRAEGKVKAEIHDFIVTPPEGNMSLGLFKIEKQLVEKELLRYIEFAQLAINNHQASHELLPLKERFGLLHMG